VQKRSFRVTISTPFSGKGVNTPRLRPPRSLVRRSSLLMGDAILRETRISIEMETEKSRSAGVVRANITSDVNSRCYSGIGITRTALPCSEMMLTRISRYISIACNINLCISIPPYREIDAIFHERNVSV